jgi:AcrR family transcriptional regulator
VTQAAEKSRDRISRRQVDKFAERRAQLADAALVTLSELGYARTSLREIALNSEFSHGVLHYYFNDKVDLITESVRQYKAHCVTRYDEIVATSATAEELKRSFAAGLANTLREDAAMHRLWYDLRAQSLFEPSFRADVAEIDESLERMIWRIVSQYAELAGSTPAVPSEVAYAIFDGLFEHSLIKHIYGKGDADRELQAHAEYLMDNLMLNR